MLAVGAAGDTADPCSQEGGNSGEKEFKKGRKSDQGKSEGQKVWETVLQMRGGGGAGSVLGSKAENS